MAVVAGRGTGARTLKLLECIAVGECEFALQGLAERAGLAPSTTHRLLEFWVQRDLIERAGPKAYRFGPELFRIASIISQKFEIARIARPLLEELWAEWHETASLCLYKPASRSATVAESIASPHPLQFVLERYSEISLVRGSLGRVILAQLPAPEVEAILARAQPGRLSHRPPPPRRVLLEELQLIREQGYALYEDEMLNIVGVSAPVFGPARSIAGCLGVTLPAARLRKSMRDRLPRAVQERAQRLSTALGCT